MNVQLQGVYVYSGDPQHPSVFRGQEFRDRRRRILKAAVAAVLAMVLAVFLHSAFMAIAQPPQAKAETGVTAVAATDNQTQPTDTAASSQ